MTTRKHRAAVLAERLARGPSLGLWKDGPQTIGIEEAERRVQLWLSTWVTPDVVALVPELKTPKPGEWHPCCACNECQAGNYGTHP